MARRFSAPYQSEPVSSLASWARNLAVFSIVAVLVSIFIVRFGFLEVKPALATFFDALAGLRTGDGANTAVYAGLYSAEQQRLAYPDIETVELDVPVQRAYEVTLQVVTKRKWLVIDERAPQLPRRTGRIEAVARTPIMGFREDVSIRATPDGEGSRVDIRSSSRYFESDLGSNAARVTKLIEDINNAVDNAKPVKKPPAPAKVQPKVVKK